MYQKTAQDIRYKLYNELFYGVELDITSFSSLSKLIGQLVRLYKDLNFSIVFWYQHSRQLYMKI